MTLCFPSLFIGNVSKSNVDRTWNLLSWRILFHAVQAMVGGRVRWIVLVKGRPDLMHVILSAFSLLNYFLMWRCIVIDKGWDVLGG